MFSQITSRRVNNLTRRMGIQEAKPAGPSLGEFYGQFQGLPGLRGLWFPGSLDNTGAMYDQSGQGRTLTYNGNPTLAVYNNLVPYMDYDGGGDYHSRADEAGLDITGGETTIAAALNGLTLLTVVRLNSLTAADGIVGKYLSAGDQRSYAILSAAGPALQFVISGNGTAGGVRGPTVGITLGVWNFAALRFRPSVATDGYLNGVLTESTASPAATVFSGTATFEVARRSGTAGTEAEADIAMVALAAAAWPDELLHYLWQRSRTLLGI